MCRWRANQSIVRSGRDKKYNCRPVVNAWGSNYLHGECSDLGSSMQLYVDPTYPSDLQHLRKSRTAINFYSEVEGSNDNSRCCFSRRRSRASSSSSRRTRQSPSIQNRPARNRLSFGLIIIVSLMTCKKVDVRTV